MGGSQRDPVTAGCRSDVVRSNKHVNKATGSEDIQQ